MVGIGIAGCAPCNCEPADCCFPSDVVSFTLVSDSACPLNDEVVTITRTTYTDSGESTTYTPNGNAIWVGTYDSSMICGSVDEIKVIMYCATISDVENWVAELYCDGTRQATIATTEFTCTDGELTAVLFIRPDLGALCCGCAGLPCGAGGSVGTVTLPAECEEVDNSVTTCSECGDGAPAQYRVTGLSGLSNGTCSGCAGTSSTFTMTHSTDCIWTDLSDLGCSITSVNTLIIGATWVTLWLDSELTAEYRLATSSWNCLGSNVLSLNTNNGACSGWPATLTVAPV